MVAQVIDMVEVRGMIPALIEAAADEAICLHSVVDAMARRGLRPDWQRDDMRGDMAALRANLFRFLDLPGQTVDSAVDWLTHTFSLSRERARRVRALLEKRQTRLSSNGGG